ncbi:MAG: hypothetical protein CNE96_10685 [Rhodobacteraceae bacterium MED-G08]|nr:hypothetical protein [Marinovum sp.]OUU07689.1 MAG: hypothetical protein CBB98_11745 [Rhodobacteraceae bacterium TMED38]PDH57943.1 MAG: hypothetical protein CNE96_10685 [Rhodobacteraceae bacterium MED-G08]
MFFGSFYVKLYLDSFDVESWQEWIPSGLFYGITTNPILAERAGLFYPSINWSSKMALAEKLNVKEFHIQLPSCDETAISFAAQRKEEAQNFNFKFVVKVPLTKEGVKLVPEMKRLGLSILMTACYHSKQYITADAIEADYIAPYFGRMEEAGLDAYDHMSLMKDLERHSTNRCKILVASIRSVEQMITLAAQGHLYFTISPAIADELLTAELTVKAVSEFDEAATKVEV